MDELHQRGQALENLFFKQKDKELLEKMRANLASQEGRNALTSVTGISDAGTLDALTAVGISAESIASVSLIPLVVVAWSDGAIQDNERKAILDAANAAGVTSGSPGYQLLDGWLQEKPADDLLDSWKAYVSALKTTLDETAYGQIKTSILSRAKDVAEAAGGFLGLGNKVSDSEESVIAELESAL